MPRLGQRVHGPVYRPVQIVLQVLRLPAGQARAPLPERILDTVPGMAALGQLNRQPESHPAVVDALVRLERRPVQQAVPV